MYIYKYKDSVKLIDTINTDDEYEIEERIIQLIRKEKACKKSYKFNTRFTGVYTLYEAEGLDYVILTSTYILDENGKIKQSNSK